MAWIFKPNLVGVEHLTIGIPQYPAAILRIAQQGVT
jgi:hypothetical protein